MLIPDEVAEIEWDLVRSGTAVHDAEALKELVSVLEQGLHAFDIDGARLFSPAGTVRIAAAACQTHPAIVLDWLMKQEEEIREKCKRGGKRHSHLENKEVESSPEWEYRWYLEYEKPTHEVLRQWCGYREVLAHERLTAAEAEVQRLDILVAQLIDHVKGKGDDMFADIIETEHNRDRITPARVRPVVDMPLAPHEIPVREATRRRSWGA